MKIDRLPNEVMTLQRARREQDKQLQHVFTELLHSVGRDGYASAETADHASTESGVADADAAQSSLVERIEQSWDSWYRTELLGRYASPEAPRDLGENFGDVLRKAHDRGGYVDPKSFLNRLSTEELETVQAAHWLADEIHVDSLTEEGALNLLIPPAAQIDVNRDGLTQTGAAFGIRFPDSTTPPEVAAAWEEATDGMPMEQVMLYELQMKLPLLTANFITNAEGSVVGVRDPDDPDFINPMNDEEYSYLKVTRDWIEHLDYLKNQIDAERYERDRRFWQSFQERLEIHGAE